VNALSDFIGIVASVAIVFGLGAFLLWLLEPAGVAGAIGLMLSGYWIGVLARELVRKRKREVIE
jgi:membrane protein implicated in regulation of membrane protease activity